MIYTLTDVALPHYSYENNAKEIWDALRNMGLTEESAAGILGNVEAESYCNPGQGEIGHGMSQQYGLGLIQWTPSGHQGPNPIVTALGEGWYNGYRQVAYINGGDAANWITTTSYPYTWGQYKTLTSVSLATHTYFANRERGTWSDSRLTYANHYYSKFTGREPEPTPPEPPAPVEDNTILAVLINMFRPKDFIHEKTTIQKLLERGFIK